MPCGADLSGDLDLHQLLYQRTHRFAKEVHIRSGLVKKLLQRDANVGGHGGFLLPCCCCSHTHGTRSWPLASREQPPSGIYTTTWDSSSVESPFPSSKMNCFCARVPRCFLGLGIGVINFAGRRPSMIRPVGCPCSSSSQCRDGYSYGEF